MATSIDQSEFVKTALRLPPALHAAVHASAKETGRSYNGELIALLEAGLNPRGSDTTALTVSLAHAERQAAMSDLEVTANVYAHAASAASLLILLQAAPAVCKDILGADEYSEVIASATAAIEAAEEREVRSDVDAVTHRANEADRKLKEAKQALRNAAAAGPSAKDQEQSSPKKMLVGNLGTDRESIYEKVLVRAESVKTKRSNNKGPARSPNARKPKP